MLTSVPYRRADHPTLVENLRAAAANSCSTFVVGALHREGSITFVTLKLVSQQRPARSPRHLRADDHTLELPTRTSIYNTSLRPATSSRISRPMRTLSCSSFPVPYGTTPERCAPCTPLENVPEAVVKKLSIPGDHTIWSCFSSSGRPDAQLVRRLWWCESEL